MSVPTVCPACGASLPDETPLPESGEQNAGKCPGCGVTLQAGTLPGPCYACQVKAVLEVSGQEQGDFGEEGRYKLVEEIGEGAFGVVYLAEQTEPVKRRVALKVLKAGMDTREIVARFEAERQALALMDHPNIARVFDGGETESGRPFFVMELVHGVSLTKYCDTNKLSTRQRLELFLQILSAVHHAHQKGVIHRDLKPSNIMVSRSQPAAVEKTANVQPGEEGDREGSAPMVKVIDFGIAKAVNIELTARTLFTQQGVLMGSPQYMSPEQADMKVLDIDTRSDLYSLGVILYELLTGSTPLDAQGLREGGYAEMQRLMKQDPPRPSTRISKLGNALTEVASHRNTQPMSLGKVVRGDLDCIVMKAIEQDRKQRYETADRFAADIQRYLKGEPVQAHPPGLRYRFWKLVRRYPAQAAVVALVMAFGAGTIGFFRSQAKERERQLHLMNAAAEKSGMQLPGWRDRSLAAIRTASEIRVDDRLRILATGALSGVDAHQTVPKAPPPASWAVFDPDGKRILIAGQRMGPGIWDGNDNTSLQMLEPAGVGPVAFSGVKPVQLRQRSNDVFEFRDLESQQILKDLQVPADAAGLSPAMAKPETPPIMLLTPDGLYAAAAIPLSGERTNVVVWTTATGQLIDTFSHAGTTAAAMTPNASMLALGDNAGSVTFRLVRDRSFVHSLKVGGLAVRGLAFGGGGLANEAGIGARFLAVGDSGGLISTWEISDPKIPVIHTRYVGAEYDVYSLAWSRNGILAAGGRGLVRLLYPNGKELLSLPDSGDYVRGLTFSPDGSRLVVCPEGTENSPGRISAWNLEFGRSMNSLLGLTAHVSKVCVSPDGRFVAALDHAWNCALWDANTGTLLELLKAPTGVMADNAALAFARMDASMRLICATGSEARAWDITNAGESYTVSDPVTLASLPSGLADILTVDDLGRQLLFRMESGNVGIVRDLANQSPDAPLATIQDFNSGVLHACWIPGRPWIAIEGKAGSEEAPERILGVFDSMTGNAVWRKALKKTIPYAGFHAFRQGALTLLYTPLTNATWAPVLLDAATGMEQPPEVMPDYAVAVSPSGKVWVERGIPGGGERGWSLYKKGSAVPWLMLDGERTHNSTTLSFSADGSQLVWGNDDGSVSNCFIDQTEYELESFGISNR